MYNYVCTTMYVHLCMYNYVCTTMYVQLCMYIYVCTTCMYNYVYTFLHTYGSVFKLCYKHTYIHSNTHTYIYMTMFIIHRYICKSFTFMYIKLCRYLNTHICKCCTCMCKKICWFVRQPNLKMKYFVQCTKPSSLELFCWKIVLPSIIFVS
jgi:hypothetical protein